MSIWIEFRCSSGSQKSECLSFHNIGPKGLAKSTRASVISLLQQLDTEAIEKGWKNTSKGWYCPHCLKSF